MSRTFSHIVLPAFLGLLFFAVALSPVQTFGCRMRGLTALTIAFVSAFWALGSAIAGAARKRRGDPDAVWWMGRTLILIIPVIAMIIMA